MARSCGFLIVVVLVAGCAAPKPILYPNAHLGGQVAGSTAAGGAIGSASGAVGGAVVGHPGRGAVVGAAAGATGGFLRGLFRRSPPSNAYKQFVQRCLKERGYDSVGWE